MLCNQSPPSPNSRHILLDQVFSYDQGYNALEAMAKGKVVFTGAETEFLNQYQLQIDNVCINATPNENQIIEKISYLIEHPEKIIEISKNARNFIEKEHAYKIIANKMPIIYMGRIVFPSVVPNCRNSRFSPS